MPWTSAAFTFTFVVWAAGWMIRGSNPVRRKSSVSSPQRPNQLWDLPSLLFDGRRTKLSLGVKRPGLEALHSRPGGDMREWIGTSTPLM